MSSRWKVAALVAAAAVVGAAMFAVGRLSAPNSTARSASDSAPNSASASATPGVGDYFDGLRVGEAQGRADGRALQEGAELPRSERHVAQRAFRAGYVAGMNDVFAGYDGGWQLGVPWIVTIEGGSGQVAYRIRDRTQLEPGVDYYLCPDGRSLCQRRR